MKKNKAWAEFLLLKMHEKEIELGGRMTISEFAEYLGENQPTVSRWLAGTNPDPLKYESLGSILGPEFYEIFDVPKPDPLLSYVKRHWDEIPPRTKSRIAEMVEKYITSRGEKEPRRENPQPNQK